jgi:hypothetical protein
VSGWTLNPHTGVSGVGVDVHGVVEDTPVVEATEAAEVERGDRVGRRFAVLDRWTEEEQGVRGGVSEKQRGRGAEGASTA